MKAYTFRPVELVNNTPRGSDDLHKCLLCLAITAGEKGFTDLPKLQELQKIYEGWVPSTHALLLESAPSAYHATSQAISNPSGDLFDRQEGLAFPLAKNRSLSSSSRISMGAESEPLDPSQKLENMQSRLYASVSTLIGRLVRSFDFFIQIPF